MVRLRCPSSDLDEEKRYGELVDIVKEWVYSPALKMLVNCYNGIIPSGMTFKAYLEWLNDFVTIWDFRQKQMAGGERWNISDNELELKNESVILEATGELGLTNIVEPLFQADYILPLGGARMTNLLRPMKAREVVERYSSFNGKVVGLASKREINEIELPYISEYAPDAVTEYDALCTGLEKAFLLQSDYSEEHGNDENINLQWAQRKYNDKFNNVTIDVLAAPSSDKGRRANSLDTFNFFIDKYDVRKGSKILLVTSCIYVPFQLMKFMPIAMDKGIDVDCIGMNGMNGTTFSKPANYLQEIKATVNAIYELREKLCESL